MISVSDAILSRKSIRAYRKEPVPFELLNEILETARRCPSGSNIQPWFVYALMGEELNDFKNKVRQSLAVHPRGEPAEYEIYPKGLGDPYRSRRFKCGEDMYENIGIDRENKFGRLMQFARNFEFFGAPVGFLFCIDKEMGPPQWAHLGMYIQTIMLLAHEKGLATCAQEAWAAMPRTSRTFLNIPDNQILYCGMSLGYADTDAPINTMKTERAAVSEYVSLYGFQEEI